MYEEHNLQFYINFGLKTLAYDIKYPPVFLNNLNATCSLWILSFVYSQNTRCILSVCLYGWFATIFFDSESTHDDELQWFDVE